MKHIDQPNLALIMFRWWEGGLIVDSLHTMTFGENTEEILPTVMAMELRARLNSEIRGPYIWRSRNPVTIEAFQGALDQLTHEEQQKFIHKMTKPRELV